MAIFGLKTVRNYSKIDIWGLAWPLILSRKQKLRYWIFENFSHFLVKNSPFSQKWMFQLFSFGMERVSFQGTGFSFWHFLIKLWLNYDLYVKIVTKKGWKWHKIQNGWNNLYIFMKYRQDVAQFHQFGHFVILMQRIMSL